jgi:diguanylate cyclase (GGDEF)-like protein
LKYRYSIRQCLLGLVGVFVAPALLVCAGLIAEDYHHDRAEVYDDATAMARGLTAALDRELAGLATGLRVAAASGRLAHEEGGGWYESTRDVLNAGIGEGDLYLLDSSGVEPRLVSNSTSRSAGKPFTTCRFTGNVSVSIITVRRLSCYGNGLSPIAIAMPLPPGDEAASALGIGLSRSRITAILRSNGLRRGWSATIADEGGTVLLETTSDGAPSSLEAPLPIQEATNRTDGALDRIGLTGAAFVTAFSPSRVSNLTVQVQVPQAQLLDELYRPIALISLAAMLTLGLGMYGSWHIAGVISSSVSRLIDPALALGSGKSIVVDDSPLKETHALSSALFRASQSLRQARHMANHDALTGLSNRFFFEELANREVMLAERASQPLAILLVDLDGFKRINDTQGHAVGDKVLILVAQRISEFLRATDVAARFGGDEFVILLPMTDKPDALRLSNSLIELLSRPFPDVLCALSASIGIAMYPANGRSLSDLLMASDQALYRAKSAGKRCAMLYVKGRTNTNHRGDGA